MRTAGWEKERLFADPKYPDLQAAFADGCLVSRVNGRGEPTELVRFDCSYKSDIGDFCS